MNGLYNGEVSGIYPATHRLNELRSKLDEEILRHSSFENQKNIYMDIQRLENLVKGWMWRSEKIYNRVIIPSR
jgi:hypothetical protein